MDQHTFHWAPPETHQADFQHHFRWGHYRNPPDRTACGNIIAVFFFSDSSKNQYCNLVGGLNHLEKYEFVNGKDDIPYSIMENKSHVWNHQSATIYWGLYYHTTILQYQHIISILSAYIPLLHEYRGLPSDQSNENRDTSSVAGRWLQRGLDGYRMVIGWL